MYCQVLQSMVCIVCMDKKPSVLKILFHLFESQCCLPGQTMIVCNERL